jgi:tetratricopeptide (TPR) repeat protein
MPALGIGAAVFVVGLLPVLGFTPFMFQLFSTVADHYLYLPMLGIAIVAACVVNRKDSAPTRTASVAVVLVLAGLSTLQLRTWRDSIALFSRAVQLHPQIPAGHANLASALASAGRIDEAIPHFKFVADALPDNVIAQQRLAQAYLFTSQYLPAIERAQASMRLNERAGLDDSWDHILLARSLVGINRLPEALEHFSRAAELRPGDANIAAQRDALRARLASPATTQ